MRAYLVRRLLMMIPTFLGISLLVFVVLNFAPGRPGMSDDGDVAVAARGEAAQDTYQIFREQFSLDKPVLINTRFALTTADIRRDLEIVAREVPASLPERMAVEDRLADLGTYAVPHLVAVMKDADAAGQTALRDTAAYFLRKSAPRRLINPFDASPSPTVRTYNDAVSAERVALSSLRYGFDAPEAQKRAVLDAWARWYDGVNARFEYDSTEKVRIFFLDTRFATYWANLIRLDFGISMSTRQPVITTLLSKLKYSLSLSFLSLLLAYAIAIPLGIFSAARRGTRADRALTVASFMLYSLPSFFVATLLLYFFSEGSNWQALRIFPTGGFQSVNFDDLTAIDQLRDILWHLVLPVACLTYGSFAALSRYMRTGLLEVLASDYIRTARAKGLPERLVVGKHALRNGLLPIVTLLANLLPAVLGGSVVIEYIFGIPGIGEWTINSIYQSDYNVLMGVQLLTTILVLFGMLLTDIGYALIDPQDPVPLMVGPATPLAEPAAPPAERRGASHAAFVLQRLGRNRAALLGLYSIFGLFVLATVAPVLASNQPFYWNAGSGPEFPWLSALFNRLLFENAVDVFFNVLLVAAPIASAAVWLSIRSARQRRQPPPSARLAARVGAGILLLFLAVTLERVGPLENPFHFTRQVVNYRAEQERLLALGLAPSAVFPPVPYSYRETDPLRGLQPPGTRHWLGTDLEGRDVFCRMLFGTRISLTIGIVAVALYVSIGTFLGALAGYFGGAVDNVISRLIEVMITFPSFFLILTLAALVQQRSIFHVMVIIGLTSWTSVARLVRAEFLRQKSLDYVQAALAMGLRRRRIIFFHILPNAIAPALVAATFGVASAILIESSLSFLGIGDASVPSWGETLNAGRVQQKLWLVLAPGAAIFFVVTVFNLVGEAIRDALDPTLKL